MYHVQSIFNMIYTLEWSPPLSQSLKDSLDSFPIHQCPDSACIQNAVEETPLILDDPRDRGAILAMQTYLELDQRPPGLLLRNPCRRPPPGSRRHRIPEPVDRGN